MIGIIVVGHGNFGSGMLSAFKVITGKPNHMIGVDYLLEESVDQLEEKLKVACDELKRECTGLLIFCDIAEGAPYKAARKLSQGDDQVEIVGGCNLPMITESSLARGFMDDVKVLSDMAEKTGKDQVIRWATIEKE